MTEEGKSDRILDRPQASKVLVCDVRSEERHRVGPERVEGYQTC